MRGGEGRVVETRDETQSNDISRNNELLSRVRSAGEEGCGSCLADVLEWGVDNRQNGGKELSESEEHNAILDHDAPEEPIPQRKLPRNPMVLQRDNPTLLEKDTPSVLQMGAPMILQKGTPLVLPRDTPIQMEIPMVLQRDTPLVLQKDTPMILPKDTPIQRETLIVLQDTPMVLQRDTLIVLEKDTPMVLETDTPIQRETPMVLQRDAPIILQRDTPMVLQRDTPIILQRDTPMVLQRDTPVVLLRRDTPRVLQRDTPMVLQRDIPIVLQKDNLMILQGDTPIVLQSDTPTIQRESPLVQQKDTPAVPRDGFLPHYCLRVLLVEDDDSTRHVVSALLRNCNYEVTCACDGLEAWQLLKNQESQFDLVLTEVVMPNLSGIDLLCKIMTHKSLKCIPVIMMSSHDSMGIVFKCLSKGAADFLVKPVRKNELKNLWQHVWRRCHSSSGGSGGGGSEQAQNVPQPNSAVAPENSGGNSDRNDNRSRVKREVGIDTPWERSSQGCSKSQGIAGSERHHTVPECNGLWKDVDFAMGHGDFEIAAASREGDAAPQYANAPKSLADLVYAMEHKIPSIISIDEREKVKEGDPMAMGPSAEAVNLINSIAYKERETEDWRENACRVELREELLRTKVAPDLTLTLLELQPNHSCFNEERITLRYSGNSAFSRYISRNFTPSLPAATSYLNGFSQMVGGYSMGCSTTDSMGSNIPTKKVGSSMGSGKGSAFAYPFQQAINDHEKTSGQDASLSATTTIRDEAHLGKGHSWSLPLLPFPSGMLPPCEGISRVYGPMHPTMFYPHFNTPCWTANSPQISGKAEVLDHHASHEHTHHHQHHHHNHQHITANTLKTNKQEEHTMTDDGACGSRCKGPEIDNGESGSGTGNGSATGSSNVNDSDNTIVFGMGGTGRITDSPKHVDCRSGIMASNVGISPDQSRIMRREAALTKFRQKRKERCFDKKVRYQSRKRLAEQRPRVRGQFVRQCENNIDLS